jgi:hypothetical protein
MTSSLLEGLGETPSEKEEYCLMSAAGTAYEGKSALV